MSKFNFLPVLKLLHPVGLKLKLYMIDVDDGFRCFFVSPFSIDVIFLVYLYGLGAIYWYQTTQSAGSNQKEIKSSVYH